MEERHQTSQLPGVHPHLDGERRMRNVTDARFPPLDDPEMNGLVEPLISGHKSNHSPLTPELAIVAVHLMEAACRARDGDPEATRAHLAHAIALLRGIPSLGPTGSALLSHFERPVVRGGLSTWQTRRVSAHVNATLSGRIRIHEIARLLDFSASHFCRAFKCTFGASPRQYVLRRRIELAQSLMLTTDEPLGSIALRCGMCDQQHFTRSFRRIVGQTPSMWRRTRRDSLLRARAFGRCMKRSN
jgi:AraC family transcriptional regulator